MARTVLIPGLAGRGEPVDLLVGLSVIRRRGAARTSRQALHEHRFPLDIGSLARYGPAFARLPRARAPFSPLTLDEALPHLASWGVTVG